MSSRGPSIAPRSQAIARSPLAMSPPSAMPNKISTKPVKTNPSPRPISSPNASAHQLTSSASEAGFPQIITSKEWVLPPRPKPGRKPSVDTPASKRKAQNRAAQRAFRERRATRVQELEEKLLEVEKEKEVKELGLVNTINKLKIENQFLMKSLEQMRADINSLKTASSAPSPSFQLPQNPSPIAHLTTNENQYSSPYNQQINHLQKSNNSPMGSAGSPAGSNSSYSVQQISPAPSADSPPVFHNHPHHHQNQQQHYAPSSLNQTANVSLTPVSNNTTPDKPLKLNTNHADFDCGICLKDECLCESVGLKDTTNADLENKSLEETINSFKPMAAVSLKSKKRKISNAEPKEIDFTKQFSKKPMPDLKRLKHSHSNNSLFQAVDLASKKEEAAGFNEASPVENCGFCSDDTPCVCREAAKEAARLNESLNKSNSSTETYIKQEEQEFENEDETSLPPIQLNSNSFRKTSLPVMHPGPSVEIREITNLTPGAVPTVVRRNTNGGDYIAESPENRNESESTGGCTGNPGTCAQCQTDPMSTLFCATVANKVKGDEEQMVDSPGGPLSAASPARDFGTSKSYSTPPAISRTGSKSNIPTLPVTSMTNPSTPLATTPGGSVSSSTGMFIPCADAYKTLSRHKKFNSVDFSTLVGKLTTRGMQVEVQSVANVLRELDRRLYN